MDFEKGCESGQVLTIGCSCWAKTLVQQCEVSIDCSYKLVLCHELTVGKCKGNDGPS
jgi:hypothetical protein